jgi:energy-coupling factor transporter ATP-binding protein EcfA2
VTTWDEPPDQLDAQALAEGLTPAPTNGTRNGHRTPPHDDQTEAAIIGAALITTTAHQAAADTGLQPHHFYRPRHRHLWAAINATNADHTLTVAWLTDHQLLDDIGGPSTITQLLADAPGTTRAGEWATRIVHLHRLRQALAEATEIQAAVYDGDGDRVAQAIARLDHQALPDHGRLEAEALAEFCDTPEPAYDWIITGLLEHGDRILLTGPEGGGKSTLIRQIAVQAAAGIHPFTHQPIAPLTVLLLDLENSRRQALRALRPLRIAAGHEADQRLHVAIHIEGLEINEHADAGRLAALIDHLKPDLVCGGPVYKLVGGDPTEEGPAKTAALTIDRLRATHGFALLLETHQPHETGGSKSRVERPYGASLWKRWPEFGLHLAATGALRHWRGARDERAWPAALQRGGAWPWTVADVPPDPAGRPFDHYRKIIVAALETSGAELSQRGLYATVTVDHPDLSRSAVFRAADKLAEEGAITLRLGPRNSKMYSTREDLL